MQFGMPPKQLSTTDSAQLLGLIVATKVLEDAASVQFGKVDKSDISVILGVASATEMVGQMASRIQRPHWIKALRDAGIAESKVVEVCDGIEATYPEWDESTFPGLLGNVVAGRIANRLVLVRAIGRPQKERWWLHGILFLGTFFTVWIGGARAVAAPAACASSRACRDTALRPVWLNAMTTSSPSSSGGLLTNSCAFQARASRRSPKVLSRCSPTSAACQEVPMPTT